MLLIHGFPGAPGSMRPWADHLVAEGYTVRVPLLPGHGTRWQDANRTTFDDWLAAVTADLQELTASCRAVVVCGLSMGGTLTLRLAELYPDAMAGIVLVNPSVLTLRKDGKYLLPVLRYVLPAYPGIIGDIAKPGVVEPGYKYIPVKAMYSLSQAWKVVRPDLPKVTVPVLLLHSRVDHIVEPVNSAGGPGGDLFDRRHRHRAGAQLPRGHPGLRRRVDLHLVRRVHREGHGEPV